MIGVDLGGDRKPGPYPTDVDNFSHGALRRHSIEMLGHRADRTGERKMKPDRITPTANLE